MNKKDLITEFSKYFDSQLANELVSDYEKLKSADFGKDHAYVGQCAGKFYETAIKVLANLKLGWKPTLKGLSFEDTYTKLTNLPKPTVEDETLCQLMPEVLRAGYTIRNKKRVAHARGIDPQEQDRRILVSAADWIMSELIRLYHTTDEEKINAFIRKIVARNTPLMQEINGKKIILDRNLSAPLALLLTVYSNNGQLELVKVKEMLGKHYLANTLTKALSAAIDDRRLYVDEASVVHITEKGLAVLEAGMQK